MDYQELTPENFKDLIRDLTIQSQSDKDFIVFVTGYTDEEGKFHCKALEDFEKAVEEELKKYEVRTMNIDPAEVVKRFEKNE